MAASLLVMGLPIRAEAGRHEGRPRPASRYARTTHLPPLESVARSYLLVDAGTGEVLEAKNPHEALVPASLTKVMTLRLVFRALREGKIHLHDLVDVSRNAWGGRRPLRGTSLMFIQPGRSVTVEQLITGMAVASANDAAVALAEHVAGDVATFVKRMNAEAAGLGLKSAAFHDPHGLSLENRISAADMARLALAMLRDYPEYLNYASKPYVTYGGITQRNHLRLLGQVEGVDGFKTGFLAKAGFNTVVTARRGDKRLLAVVMGTPRRIAGRRGGKVRDALAAKLLSMGFDRKASSL